MSLRHVSAGKCLVGVSLAAALSVWGIEGNRAVAREAAHPHAASHEGHNAEGSHEGRKGGSRHGVLHGAGYHPPFSAIVVDDNTGQALYEVNADEPRHPASLTKIMTLYMLFEQLEAGNVKLDTQLPVSAHAASQAPVKLGLKPNSTIAVEDALRAMVTKSANDAACVVAEFIGGGDEAEGARRMTAKAHALGMVSSTYVNGSGLPAEEQITTARDQALLGLVIHNRFPTYYRYFSTLNFSYHGRDMHNHNGLLGNVPGVDGIKTGYTEASGYNLVASTQRGDRHIVSVILGGTSNGTRDAAMRKLIEDHMNRASAQRMKPALTEIAGGTAANPVLTVSGAPPTTFVAAPPVAPSVVPATAVALPPAAMPAAATAAARTGNVETANPLIPDGAIATVTGMRADHALRQKPSTVDEKPHARAKQARTPALPQVQGLAPAATAPRAAHPRSPASRTSEMVPHRPLRTVDE
jgi:D-alanyl-D-alanine carboxypeptidase